MDDPPAAGAGDAGVLRVPGRAAGPRRRQRGGGGRFAGRPKSIFGRAPTDRAARVEPEDARAIVTVTATSVTSRVSSVLSPTFVALSLAAQLLSPRMLDAVLRERRWMLGFSGHPSDGATATS